MNYHTTVGRRLETVEPRVAVMGLPKDRPRSSLLGGPPCITGRALQGLPSVRSPRGPRLIPRYVHAKPSEGRLWPALLGASAPSRVSGVCPLTVNCACPRLIRGGQNAKLCLKRVLALARRSGFRYLGNRSRVLAESRRGWQALIDPLPDKP
jgi:hypothetical protein